MWLPGSGEGEMLRRTHQAKQVEKHREEPVVGEKKGAHRVPCCPAAAPAPAIGHEFPQPHTGPSHSTWGKAQPVLCQGQTRSDGETPWGARERLVPRTCSLLGGPGSMGLSSESDPTAPETLWSRAGAPPKKIYPYFLLSLCLTFGKPEPRSARMKSRRREKKKKKERKKKKAEREKEEILSQRLEAGEPL